MLCETFIPGRLSSALDCLLQEGLITGAAMLVRGIDSTRDQADLGRILVRCGLPHTLETPGWVVASNGIPLALEHNLFTGFDEVWLFDGPAKSLRAVPEDWDFGNDSGEPLHLEDMPTALRELVSRDPTPLMLRDGCGLHCMTLNEAYVACLRRMAVSHEES
jgi:hypothetical protein